LKPLAIKAVKNADVVFAPSRAAEDFLIKNFSVDRKKIIHLPLGVDTDFYRFDSDERQRLRTSLGVKNSETLLISTGRISREKEFEIVINSLKKLNSKKAKYLLVGDGDAAYLKKLKQLVDRLDLEKKVLFHPFVPEKNLYKFYSAADIAIWPKRPTIGIINAIGCELPVIIPNEHTMNHLVEEKNGLLFTPGNIQDFRNKLEQLVEDPKQLSMMRKKAREIVLNKLSFKKLALKDIEVYEKYKEISS
jgi:glycosyltransferase involved in cell wall biosynthesis